MRMHFGIPKLCSSFSCMNFKIISIAYGLSYTTAVGTRQQNVIQTNTIAEILYSLTEWHYLLKSLLCAAFYQ